jgi:hypothetical protein
MRSANFQGGCRWNPAIGRCRGAFGIVLAGVMLLHLPPALAESGIAVGAAKIDITPEYPIRMGGYAMRKTRSQGVEQKIWAKALVIRAGDDQPVALITVDNNGIAEQTYRAIVKRLAGRVGWSQDRITICSSHTHTGPLTSFKSPNLFVEEIPAEDQAIIDRYTDELLSKIEQVASDALKAIKRAQLHWAQGTMQFARNRRGTDLKPVDHSLPVLVAKDLEGHPIAILTTYACHCTTLGGSFTRICGDWAGYAQEAIERDNPGAVALVSIGCGADANPHLREGADSGLALAKQHGENLAREVKSLLSGDLKDLRSKRVVTKLRELQLPFAPHFTEDQLKERAQKPGIVGYHARKNLARLQRGANLPTTLYYPLITWNFDDQLSLLFLPGEVVVDYAIRLRKENPTGPLWIHAYANYVPCYIPSKRILNEGGYEAEESLWYYDRPARLKPDVEDLIINNLNEMLRNP